MDVGTIQSDSLKHHLLQLENLYIKAAAIGSTKYLITEQNGEQIFTAKLERVSTDHVIKIQQAANYQRDHTFQIMDNNGEKVVTTFTGSGKELKIKCGEKLIGSITFEAHVSDQYEAKSTEGDLSFHMSVSGSSCFAAICPGAVSGFKIQDNSSCSSVEAGTSSGSTEIGRMGTNWPGKDKKQFGLNFPAGLDVRGKILLMVAGLVVYEAYFT